MESYQLEKSVWGDSDFQVMGWHDATIWSTYYELEEFKFLCDLDYIFKWILPAEGAMYYKFWVAPVTMVFENACDLNIDIESSQGTIEVSDLHRGEIDTTASARFPLRTYRFECPQGEISIKATGFQMFVRQAPILLDTQRLTFRQRNGVNFGLNLER